MTSTLEQLSDYCSSNPADETARAALADLLAEEGDYGMLALVRNDRWPTNSAGSWWWARGDCNGYGIQDFNPRERLPRDWFESLDPRKVGAVDDLCDCDQKPYLVAIEAFHRLPPERQQEILDGQLRL